MVNEIPIDNSHELLSEYWSKHITCRNQGNLSKAAYCRKHNLIIHQYYYWEQKFKNNCAQTEFLPIQIVSEAITKSVSMEKLLCSLNFNNGNELKIYDQAALSALISILR